MRRIGIGEDVGVATFTTGSDLVSTDDGCVLEGAATDDVCWLETHWNAGAGCFGTETRGDSRDLGVSTWSSFSNCLLLPILVLVIGDDDGGVIAATNPSTIRAISDDELLSLT